MRAARLHLAGALALWPLAAPAAPPCAEIRFPAGQSAATVKGSAPPEDTVCYRFAAGAGQTARLRITGRNMIFGVEGLVDAQGDYSFRTEARSYQVNVGQLMRSVTPEPYALTLSIR